VCAAAQSAKFRSRESDSTRGAPDAGAADCTCTHGRSVMRLLLIRFAVALAFTLPIVAVAAR